MLANSVFGWAQVNSLTYSVEATRQIEHRYYDTIEGTPYLYDEWHNATLLGSDGKIYSFSRVNFNGYTHHLEADLEGKVKEFNASFFLKVTIDTGENKEIFMTGLHADFLRDIICIIYDGEQVKFIKKFDVTLEDLDIQKTRTSMRSEQFFPSIKYYIMLNGNLNKVKLKKKKIIEVLGHKSAIEEYAKKEKINFSSEEGLKLLLNYYDSLQ